MGLSLHSTGLNGLIKDGLLLSPNGGVDGQVGFHIIPEMTPNYPSSGVSGTYEDYYTPARGETGWIFYGNNNVAGGEYRHNGVIRYSAAESNTTPVAISISVSEYINSSFSEFQVSNGKIQVKNTYGYGINLVGFVIYLKAGG